MRQFIKQIQEITNFPNTSFPLFVEAHISFLMIYTGVSSKLFLEYILDYQLPHQTPTSGGQGGLNTLPTKRNQGSLKKWLIPGLERGKMNLEQAFVQKSLEVFRKQWKCVNTGHRHLREVATGQI